MNRMIPLLFPFGGLYGLGGGLVEVHEVGEGFLESRYAGK